VRGFARRQWVGILVAVAIVGVTLTPQFRSVVQLPRNVTVPRDSKCELMLDLPFSVLVRSSRGGLLNINGMPLGPQWTRLRGPTVGLETVELGSTQLEFRLFGVIPVRRLSVEVVPALEVVPGGHSIGVVLGTEGLSIVGYAPVLTRGGRRACPAREAGLRPGDVIVAADGLPVESREQLSALVEAAGASGRSLEIEVKRDGATIERTVEPIFCREQRRYRLGVSVSDGAAGVGTLTFYDPKLRTFVALGHIVADAATGIPLNVKGGKIVRALVSGVEHGSRGRPGEKIGVFVRDGALGTIEENTEFGVVGRLESGLENPIYPGPVPIALRAQVRRGPARILTVLNGQKVEEFDVVVERVFHQTRPSGKGMIIRVTDVDLLERTGGIVQGMSGSPIIQDGRLIGAVTHVLVGEPARGYGVFVEWMVAAARLDRYERPVAA